MATLIWNIIKGYNYVFDEIGDPRTKVWPLVGKPHIGMSLLVLYLFFVMKWGPAWMKNRKPFDIERLLIVYNIVQVIICAYCFIGAVQIWVTEYKWICQPVDFSYSESGLRMAKFVYYYYLLKIVDLMDTVFFVLRKKFNQISFLHVYHHAGMVILSWAATMYYPGGHGTMVGVINTFVHIIMYSYYLLTVAYPSVKGSLWWKKYITQLQIIQFFHNVVHMGCIVFMPNCGFPRWTAAVFLPQNTFMLILFLDFYIKAYIKKSNPKPVKKELEASEGTNYTKNSEIQWLIESSHEKENLNTRS